MNQPYFCQAPIQNHRAYTWDASQLCKEHRAPTIVNTFDTDVYATTSTATPKPGMVSAEQAWTEWQAIVGLAPRPLNASEIIQVMSNAISAEFSNATKRAAYRWFPGLDYPDAAQRNAQAWSLREGIATGLFPHAKFTPKEAIAAFDEKADIYGRSLESSRIVLGFMLRAIWEFSRAVNPQAATHSITLDDYMEKVANAAYSNEIRVAFGNLLYMFPQVVQEATGHPAKVTQRFDAGLLVVPAGYEQAEQNYQQQQKAIAQQQAEQRERMKQGALIAGKVGLGAASVIGGLAKNAVFGSPAANKREADRREAEYRRDRDYNAREQARRNQKRQGSGWF